MLLSNDLILLYDLSMVFISRRLFVIICNINATDLLTITEEIEKELGFLYLIFVADSAVIYILL